MNLFGNEGHFTADPGTVRSATCDACRAKMTVERNVLGPTSFAEALGGHKHRHDRFECPYLATTWHKRIVALLSEARATESRKIRRIIEEEINDILKTKNATE